MEKETGSYSETCVMCDADGTEQFSINVEEAIDIKDEVSFKVEEAIDVKDEIPEVLIFPPIKTEQEVRLWVLCV
jgi:predicted RNA methylase